MPSWLGINYLRWQDATGNPMEDELLAIHGSGASAPMPCTADSALVEQLRACAEREIAADVTRQRHVGSLFLLAAASLTEEPAGQRSGRTDA